MKRNSSVICVLSLLCLGALLIATGYSSISGSSQPPGAGLPGPSSTTPGTSSASPFNKPQTTTPTQQPQPAPAPAAVPPHKPLPPKPPLPMMLKPFGIPGVVGLEDDRWVGTDYLGFLSKNIVISIEFVKSDQMPTKLTDAQLKTIADDLFVKNGLVPKRETIEGPPLPFLHVLLIIYPVDLDKFVVFGTSRLFEEVHVVRKDFEPEGVWQAITWENQEIVYATTDHLDAQIKALTEKLTMAFIKRFQVYNRLKGALPLPEPS